MDFQFKIILIAWIILESVHCSTNWLWQCENGYCVKSNEELEREGYASLELCQLICNDYLNVWPKPTAVTSTNKELININTELIVFYYLGPPETADFLKMVSQYFDELLTNKGSFDCKESMYNLKVYLKPSSRNLNLTLDTEESYLLTMDVQGIDLIVNITAPTVFGIRHGMETLFQLLIVNAGDDTKCLSTVSNVSIIDRPKYRHRGLLIDTARNYLSVNTIKKQIEGMALSKLNVLHLHITDSQSFPLVSSRLPNMTKFGAYSPTKIYTEQDIKDLVTFAKVRGVRLLIEIDSPAHAGMGWQWGPQAGLGHLAVCVNKQPWRSFCVQPPCGQLNPVNPKLYPVLTDLYKGIIETTPDTGMFHMGGDEVFIPCWNTTPEILKHLNGKPLTEETYLDLWADYQRKNLAAFDSAIGHEKTSVVVWTSTLTQPDGITKYLPKDRYIIQTWVTEAENDLLTQLLSLGYKLIISTKDKWYLDHGFWGSWGYHKWKAVYDNQMYKKYDKAILGGEVCMWGELVDDSNIDARVWPRASAAAERMWSDPTTKADVAQTRFFAQRERLKARGVHSERVMPAWCVENEGECQTFIPPRVPEKKGLDRRTDGQTDNKVIL